MKILEVVAERLAKIGPEIEGRVVEILAEKELAKRETQIVAAYSEFDTLNKRFKRINRGDIQTFDAKGAVASESYSKPRLKEIKEVSERLAKIENAIGKALIDSNFEPLDKLGGPMKVANEKPSEEDTTEGESKAD